MDMNRLKEIADILMPYQKEFDRKFVAMSTTNNDQIGDAIYLLDVAEYNTFNKETINRLKKEHL